MKVCLLANHLNPGGISAYLLTLCRHLGGPGGVEFAVASRGGAWQERFEALGVKTLTLPLTTKCEASPKVAASFFRLRSWARDNKIDLFHAHTRVTQVLACLTSRSLGLPFVTTCHGYFKPRFFRRAFPCWGERVIAISGPVREHLKHDFHVEDRRIALIANGVEIDRFRPRSPEEVRAEKLRRGLDPGKRIVGHIGRLSSVKGQVHLIRAAAGVLKTRRDVLFLIVGDGEERGALEAAARDAGVSEAVRFIPSVDETADVLAVMDVFVMPSLQEGLGLSVLEAQAAGVAVVASRVGGLTDIVSDKETGLLVGPRDEAGLSRAILRILEDGLLKERLQNGAARQVRERFTAARMAAETLAVYRETA